MGGASTFSAVDPYAPSESDFEEISLVSPVPTAVLLLRACHLSPAQPLAELLFYFLQYAPSTFGLPCDGALHTAGWQQLVAAAVLEGDGVGDLRARGAPR